MQIEQLRDAATPSEMRTEICRLRIDSPLVRSVMNMADYNGFSAEDRYTVLAYHALKESAKAREMLLEQLNITPHPFLVPHNAEHLAALVAECDALKADAAKWRDFQTQLAKAMAKPIQVVTELPKLDDLIAALGKNKQ